jgi:hypothetical protein
MDPEAMIATCRRLLTYAAEENATISLFHMDFPSLGYVTPKLEIGAGSQLANNHKPRE